MDLPIRPVSAEEFPEFFTACEVAFGGDANPAEMDLDRRLFEPQRSLAVYDGSRIVGTAGVLSMRMTVPGAVLPVAGVTLVGVQPDHRRRGVLTALMRQQLQDIRDMGTEPVAALWASEPAIYGRFGYGLAALCVEIDVPTRQSAFLGSTDVSGVRLVDVAELRSAAAGVYDRLRAEQPGWIDRDERWWDRRTADPVHWRDGGSALRHVLHTGDDGVDGYAMYNTKPQWQWGSPEGTVTVREVAATNPRAYAALWRFLLDVDLMGRLVAPVRPVDDPVLHLLVNPRVAKPRVKDNLWVRIVDLPAAIAARRYPVEGRLVVEVSDECCPWNAGRWRLEGGPDGASCVATTEDAELALSSTELGAAYLGSSRLSTLAAAGRVAELVPGALIRADRLLGWSTTAWCPEIF